MIPKIIHQIWIGPKERPINLMNSWKIKNPDFKYILWNEEKIAKENFKLQYKIDEIEEYCGKADILRYEILFKYGGIYVDADSYCIESLCLNYFINESFAVYENENIRKGLIATGVLGFESNHFFLKNIINIIDSIPISSAETNRSAWQTVGPLLFTKVYNKTFPKIKIYPSYMFYPEHYTGEKYKGHGKVFAYQFWSSTNKNYEIIDEIDVPPWLFELPTSSVSIFIVVKNNSFEDFKKTMDSLIAQEGCFFMEIVIVDNNSKEEISFNLSEEISKYKNIIKYGSIINISYYYDISLGKAYNAAMNRSNSDYVTFAFLGDYLYPGKINDQINFLHNTKGIFVGTQVKEIKFSKYSKKCTTTSYPSCSIRQWRKSKIIKIMDSKSLLFIRKFLAKERFKETSNYPCILDKALKAFVEKSYIYNIKSIQIDREIDVNEENFFSLYDSSIDDRKLFMEILY